MRHMLFLNVAWGQPGAAVQVTASPVQDGGVGASASEASWANRDNREG